MTNKWTWLVTWTWSGRTLDSCYDTTGSSHYQIETLQYCIDIQPNSQDWHWKNCIVISKENWCFELKRIFTLNCHFNMGNLKVLQQTDTFYLNREIIAYSLMSYFFEAFLLYLLLFTLLLFDICMWPKTMLNLYKLLTSTCTVYDRSWSMHLNPLVKGKRHSSLLWKAFQIGSNYFFLLHRQFKLNGLHVAI